MSKLHELAEIGQAIWLDYIRRSFLTSGELADLVQIGVRGMTSNPTIFEKAIAGSISKGLSQPGEYDSEIQRLSHEGKSSLEIYEALAIEDIRMAADLLGPVYEQTNGKDGFVSLEVNPLLARQTQETLDEARRLWQQVDRPNLMIKIPATQEGLPAISAAIADGININVTLIFSLQRYQEVIQAYLAGLKQRLSDGGKVDRIGSVASFFVSRVDSKVDQTLDEIIRSEGSQAGLAASLKGQAAVANARLAYHLFKEVFEGADFKPLRKQGANVQRPLWASTSTKNPSYSDILYVQELIGPHTVNTVPQNTLEAFLDHGDVRLTLEDRLDEARGSLESLNKLGISMDKVTYELEVEGVEAFANSFEALIKQISKKSEALTASSSFISYKLGEYGERVSAALQEMERDKVVQRIWKGDHTVWKPNPTEITNRLGWLHSYEDISMRIPQIEAIQYAIKNAGYTHGVLLGMGGSSLAPDMFSKVFAEESRKGTCLKQLRILDSTDPEAVLSIANSMDPVRTLFIVSTKSGNTEETLSFFRYFYNWVGNAVGIKDAGEHFIAITDPGSQLTEIARLYRFRMVFLNDPDVGGRYSALTYYGLIPAALMGVDLLRLLARAAQMAKQCNRDSQAQENPAAQLGAALGELAKDGRDKVTLLLSPQIVPFGDWVEQLIAESTGKEKRGILPVVGEQLKNTEKYSVDRLFVYLQVAGDETLHATIERITAAGHPIIHIVIQDIYDLGGQFFLWELATAIAGYRLGIQPFDQPDVEAAKSLARMRVKAYKETGKLPDSPPDLVSAGISIYRTQNAKTLDKAIANFLSQTQAGDYIAVQAFVPPTEELDTALQTLRLRLRAATGLAVTLGYGPRFLHSTGQLHKGDSGKGAFIQITSESQTDVPIPDQAGQNPSALTFGVLKLAQALGDHQALLDAGRRVIRFHLNSNIAAQIQRLADSIPNG